MAQDEQPSSGLLSKVVKFVRNPTVNWSDLDQPELDKESIYSKQMLKEMIERKRRNDFVRRREFDQLRKLRQREAQAHSDTSGRPSFFQSSLQSTTDDRAGTLKKIDEIEEQMSKQWWKSKDVGASNPVPLSSRAGLLRASAAAAEVRASGGERSGEVTRPHSLDAERSLPLSLTDSADADHAPHHFAATVLNTVTGGSELDAHEPRGFKNSNFPKTDLQPLESGLAAAMARNEGMHEPMVDMLAALDEALELDYDAVVSQSDAGPEFAHDPALEEAAIHFANGDDDGAEDAILALLDNPPAGTLAADVWLTLFDFYRATGRHERFDSAGIDYATRFNLSAPVWFSMPELNGLSGDTEAASATVFRWTCPAQLTASAAMGLQAAVQAKAAPTLRLNWGSLSAMDSDAMNVLVGLFGDVAARPVKVMFAHGERLQNVLRAATPAGDSTVAKQAWRLRMELLRIMGQQDAFDLVALEYCVTYEVSPPSWRDAQSSFEEVQPEDVFDMALLGDELDTSSHDADMLLDDPLPALELEPSTAPVCMGLLSGVVAGDAGALLSPLENQVRDGGLMVISCKNLIRADFSAAGSVLNWAATQQAAGRRVEFRDVHRLVATFFNVIGINENAKIILRRN
jgi:hypothetical protein